MKTSQNLNKVLSKLPKTELKSEKVELSLLDDLEKENLKLFSELGKAGASQGNYNDYLVQADKPFVKMIKDYNILIKSLPVVEGIAKRFIKAGNELGVDLKNGKTYNKVQSNIKMTNIMIELINSYKDPSSFQN